MDESKGIFLLIAGLFSIICAAADWDWFMNHRKTRLWVKLFGRNGTRIFYTILGSIFLILGIIFSTGTVGQQ